MQRFYSGTGIGWLNHSEWKKSVDEMMFSISRVNGKELSWLRVYIGGED